MLKLDHIHIKSPDPRKAAAWYQQVFGAKIAREWDILGALAIRVEVGGVPINISAQPPGQTLPAGSADPHLGLEHFGLQTSDMDGLLARVRAHDGQLLEPLRTNPEGTTIAFIRAPDNVRIELLQPKA